MALRIPTRFEHVLSNPNLKPAPLIVGVEADLQAIDRLRRTADTQQGGVLAFLEATTGIGKTTSVYSATALMSERFSQVLLVPHTVPLRELATWLSNNLPKSDGRCIPVLLDNREETDDEVGLGQLMSSLNGILRTRADIIALWPTTSEEWCEKLYKVAKRIGGASLVPASGRILVSGPGKSQWDEILTRLLAQFDQRFEDLALDPALIEQHREKADSVGEFLELVRDSIAGRVADVQLLKHLPQVVFVVSSHQEVAGEANRLRRAGSLLLKAEELVAYSPRSVGGKYWQARSAVPEHHLAYVISLFNARLTTLYPSSVAYACLQYGDEDLKAAARSEGMSPSPANGRTTIQNTDFFKFLSGTTSFDMTSTPKGKIAPATIKTYEAIQRLSATKHKALNQAICHLTEDNIPAFQASLGSFEKNLGEADSYADAVIQLNGDELYFEFHHVSPSNCKASSIAAYIMKKLQVYAVHYNLIPR